MSTELSRLYRSLATDVPAVELDRPESLRRRADRRARRRAAAAVTAVAVLVGGTVVGTRLLAAGPSPVTPPPVASPTTQPDRPSVPPSNPASAPPTPPTPPAPTVAPGTPSAGAGSARNAQPPTAIPDRAFFVQPAATSHGEQPVFSTAGTSLRPPCGGPGPAGVLAQRTRTVVYRSPGASAGRAPAGTVGQTIYSQSAGQADAYLRWLRERIPACPTWTQDGVTRSQQVLRQSGHGDAALLVEIRQPDPYVSDATAATVSSLVWVVRVGDVLTFLVVEGWEGTSADRALADDYADRADRAIRAWLG
ncbi:hypothetical protein [Plantactinospora sp. KBS50]|uniref:hypothetical protein n=1 Tax=Plantactinospora sp. KBS50 TaxID=2024580 RepID=UPI000BAAF0B9|nr:hypothetical protein [Plantactinospora sp. KBS50]ASW56616.1 hypothetical protein CIK06_24330 [Plantactinospora sp. KBS50]